MRFKITAINAQDVETQIVAHGEPLTPEHPFAFAPHNSTLSIWLKKDAAAKYKVGDYFALTQAE